MRILEFFFEKGEPTKKDMTFKKVAISAFISVIITVVIRALLRDNGIHNFLSGNPTGGLLIYFGIYLLISFVLKRMAER